MDGTGGIFRLEATDKTPLVELDAKNGSLHIAGASITENADGFFAPIHDRVEAYATTPASTTRVTIALEYFNSSTAKYLLDIFKRLDDLHATGASAVSLEWLHDADDLDMEEAGRDYRDLLELPVRLVAR